jgi:hypothetical protein
MKDIVYLRTSTKEGKKYMVTILFNNGRKKTVHFGAEGMSDYTKHKDIDRMNLYIGRHKKRENWSKEGLDTAGFWSRWILWNKPTLNSSINYTSNKFDIIIQQSPPPSQKI